MDIEIFCNLGRIFEKNRNLTISISQHSLTAVHDIQIPPTLQNIPVRNSFVE